MTVAELVPADSTESFLGLYRSPVATLERLLREGSAPTFEQLAGWEFDGLNVGAVAGGFGFNRKFRKGFYEGPERASGPSPFLQGYNIPMHQDGAEKPHRAKPSDEHPTRFGFYRVFSASKSERHKRYPQALLLDYSLGGNGFSPPSVLRDYLVLARPGNADLLLGKAYVALGPLTVVGGFFILHRARRHDFKG